MMKKKRDYIIPLKRRKQKQTDYSRRLKIIKSGKPRLAFRKSKKHSYAQIIKYKKTGDQTIVSFSTKNLEKFGWKGPTSNIPASYLLGFLISKHAQKNKIKSVVFDIGLQRSTKGGKIYAFLKGALDAGLDISKTEKTDQMFPSEDRIKGKHIEDYAKSLKKTDYKKQFSKSKPEQIQKMFGKVKTKIEKG